MRAKKLLFDEACEIKALLWDGVSQGDIARHYAISQTSVSRIRLGQAWRDARWPDGSDGAMSLERRYALMRMAQGAPLGAREGFALQHGGAKPYGTHSVADGGASRASDLRRTMAGSGPVVDRHATADVVAGRSAAAGRVPDDRSGAESDRLTDAERPSPAELAELRAARAVMLQEIADDASQDIEAALRATLTRVAPSSDENVITAVPDRSDPVEYDELPWAEVQRSTPDHPLVRCAAQSADMQRCVCAAFAMLPRNMWASQRAYTLVRDVAASLQIDIAAIMEEVEL